MWIGRCVMYDLHSPLFHLLFAQWAYSCIWAESKTHSCPANMVLFTVSRTDIVYSHKHQMCYKTETIVSAFGMSAFFFIFLNSIIPIPVCVFLNEYKQTNTFMRLTYNMTCIHFYFPALYVKRVVCIKISNEIGDERRAYVIMFSWFHI